MIGERMKKLRGNRTQEDIAKIIGVSRSRYSHYENGRSEPDLAMLEKLADSYQVSVDFLLGRTDSTERQDKLTTDEEFERWLSNPADERFFEEYNQAPEERKAALRDMWEILKKQGKA